MSVAVLGKGPWGYSRRDGSHSGGGLIHRNRSLRFAVGNRQEPLCRVTMNAAKLDVEERIQRVKDMTEASDQIW